MLSDGGRWFRRRAAGLLAAALLLRLALWAEWSSQPLLGTPLYDSDVYLHQARQLLAGRFGDPSLVAFSPLYGWLLALLHAGVERAVALQLLLGLLTLALLLALARRRSGDHGALLVAALWIGWGLPLFYETKVLSETLGLLLAVAGLSLFVEERGAGGDDREAPPPSSMVARRIAAGVVLALSVLARASLIFTLPLYLIAALLTPPSSSRDGHGAGWTRGRIGRALAVGLGMTAVLAGNGAWNRAHTGLFVPVILVSRTAAVATRSEWRGDFRAFASDGRDGDVSPWDVVDQARRRIAASGSETVVATPPPPLWGVDLLGWLRGLPAKLVATLADRETTFDYGYYGERGELRALSLLPVSFGLLELLALAGALGLLRSRRWRSLLPLLPLVAGTLATTTLFYPTSRYRLPMAIALVLLAGDVIPLLSSWRERARTNPARWRAAIALIALVTVAFSLRTLLRRPEQPADWELRMAEAAARAGDGEELQRRLDRARTLAPGDAAVAHRIELITRHAPAPPR